MRAVIIILSFFISSSLLCQRFEAGFVYSPFETGIITFDRDYIIFSDYTSLTAGDEKIHPYITALSSGVFFRYRMQNMYYQAEVDFFENKFGKSIPDWKTIGDRHFTYSAIEIPFLAGFTLNSGSMSKFRIFGGINNKLGRFRTIIFSTLSYAINEDKDHEYYSELGKKLELMNRFSYYYMDVIGGIGYTHYGLSVDLRAEKSVTNLNREMDLYNANYKSLFMVRLCLNIIINKKAGR